jgi:hypothetical protein
LGLVDLVIISGVTSATRPLNVGRPASIPSILAVPSPLLVQSKVMVLWAAPLPAVTVYVNACAKESPIERRKQTQRAGASFLRNEEEFIGKS